MAAKKSDRKAKCIAEINEILGYAKGEELNLSKTEDLMALLMDLKDPDRCEKIVNRLIAYHTDGVQTAPAGQSPAGQSQSTVPPPQDPTIQKLAKQAEGFMNSMGNRPVVQFAKVAAESAGLDPANIGTGKNLRIIADMFSPEKKDEKKEPEKK